MTGMSAGIKYRRKWLERLAKVLVIHIVVTTTACPRRCPSRLKDLMEVG
ncbi:MAG TPA: hypothetical protein VFF81_07720 [Noviherbaspirillum sp.]|nr:hypothetical protein [Noviherbaspirillum sp.]